MTPTTMGVLAEVLSPFYYHGLYIPGGSATDPGLLTDTTVMFALASAMGIVLRPRSEPDYRTDVARLPWKSSLFLVRDTRANRVGPPIRHSVDVEREGGYQERLQKAMNSGNVKKTWMVHEVLPGAQYEGMIWGPDLFRLAGSDCVVIRVGVGRTGIVRLQPSMLPSRVCLNAATAKLFGQELEEQYRILDTIRVSTPMAPEKARALMERWSIDAL